MSKKKKYFKSLKQCENIHVFMDTWYNAKSHHRRRTRFNHSDMPIYLLDRGITPPKSISLAVAQKSDVNSYIYVRDDENNIRCYEDHFALNKEGLLDESRNSSEMELLQLRRKCLQESGYDYDPCTGEVDTIEHLKYLDWLYSVTPTEKVNRQNKQKIKM